MIVRFLGWVWDWIKPVKVDYQETWYNSLLDANQDWPPNVIDFWNKAEKGQLHEHIIRGLTATYPAFKKFLPEGEVEEGEWTEGRPFTQTGESSPCPFKK